MCQARTASRPPSGGAPMCPARTASRPPSGGAPMCLAGMAIRPPPAGIPICLARMATRRPARVPSRTRAAIESAGSSAGVADDGTPVMTRQLIPSEARPAPEVTRLSAIEPHTASALMDRTPATISPAVPGGVATGRIQVVTEPGMTSGIGPKLGTPTVTEPLLRALAPTSRSPPDDRKMLRAKVTRRTDSRSSPRS